MNYTEWKEVEKSIYNDFQIFVTTCGTASNQITKNSFFKFARVLIDEATMVKETDSLMTLKNAE